MNASVVFVHGAWHTPECFDPVRLHLQKRGVETAAVELPSCGPQLASIEADVAAVRSKIAALAEAGQDIVMVMHSYGGKVGSWAVRGLSKADRSAAGKQGGIVHLLYLSSLMLPEDGRDFGVNAGTPKFGINADGGMELTDPVPYLYHDLDPDQQAHWATKLRLWNAKTLGPAPEGAAYLGHLHVPGTYLVCENDQAIPAELQRKYIEAANQAGGQIKSVVCDSAHCPQLKYPELVVKLILDEVQS
ncbi:hypothetical protein WJX73_004408 [Symbiochloris irregularis]|uniref:AB hydrolase-1 domain-containing protein n=1 Tax=Symbiochloris irregularis TaxID=706552 RepID=A0AAW1NVE6_9CHLO